MSSRAWCVYNDPCGLCCVALTYGLIAFADHAVLNHLLLPWLGLTSASAALMLAFVAISALAVASHLRAMLTDPGAVPRAYQPAHLLVEEEALPMCSRCNGFKPPRAHHCSQCDRCIMKMDHHCPWVNNCVGANNQKHFLLFVGYTAILSSFAIVLLVARFFATVTDPATLGAGGGAHRHARGGGGGAAAHHGRAARDDQRGLRQRGDHADESLELLQLCLLFFESLIFGLFTCAMLFEQIASILSDQTGIERLKQDHMPRAGGSTLALLSEAFGRPFSLLWFLPTPVRFHGLTWWDRIPKESGQEL